VSPERLEILGNRGVREQARETLSVELAGERQTRLLHGYASFNAIKHFRARLSIFLSISLLPHTCLPRGRRVRDVAQQDDENPERDHSDRCEPAYGSHYLPGRERHSCP
jgi:hypothetical protein